MKTRTVCLIVMFVLSIIIFYYLFFYKHDHSDNHIDNYTNNPWNKLSHKNKWMQLYENINDKQLEFILNKYSKL